MITWVEESCVFRLGKIFGKNYPFFQIWKFRAWILLIFCSFVAFTPRPPPLEASHLKDEERLMSNCFKFGAQRKSIFFPPYIENSFHTLDSSSPESSGSFSFSSVTSPTCKHMRVYIRISERKLEEQFTWSEEAQLCSSSSTLCSEGRPKRGESWNNFVTNK